MRFIFSRMFWGGMIVLLGISLLLQNILGINFPFWGAFWALVIIMMGLSILFPGKSKYSWKSEWKHQNPDGGVVFGEGKVNAEDSKNKYEVVFGKADFDLTKLQKPEKIRKIELECVFGTGSVKIDPNTPIVINATSVFGSVRLPDGQMTSFGDGTYRTKSYKEDEPYIEIEANSVFGTLEIIEK